MKSRVARWGVLFFFFGVIVVCWGFVLPRLAKVPSVRDRIDRFEQAGINPSAVFYTDHPKMAEIERRMDSIVNSEHSSFWGQQRAGK